MRNGVVATVKFARRSIACHAAGPTRHVAHVVLPLLARDMSARARGDRATVRLRLRVKDVFNRGAVPLQSAPWPYIV